ncbi:MAG TPA: hypothetical protein VHM19_07850, partial [Polyangiales bacterium]|nr:hypothetical protein [Polyangiales bacterium]
ALRLAERAHALAPEAPAIADTLGWIHVLRGELEPGVALLETVRKKQPDEPSVLYHLGAAYLRAGKAADGKPLLAQALRLAPASPDAPAIKALLAH